MLGRVVRRGRGALWLALAARKWSSEYCPSCMGLLMSLIEILRVNLGCSAVWEDDGRMAFLTGSRGQYIRTGERDV